MKTIVTSVIALTIATTAMAATSYDTLTRDEKSAYRIGECQAIYNVTSKEAKGDHNFYGLISTLTQGNVQKFGYKTELRKVYQAAKDDATISIALGRLDASAEAFLQCVEDVKQIAEWDYIYTYSKGN